MRTASKQEVIYRIYQSLKEERGKIREARKTKNNETMLASLKRIEELEKNLEMLKGFR